ncbi:MAG: NrdH-redoxin [Candidatus Magasanikbacteria bacterium CG11_big_fil_rev_8_21_14_0_20_43_7]|uniref:NrdH-redoxin n=1 Tax=Candidatus Magasanikbacteria bacterium CG11_big_fil_rev_8_21_14_0_20_43_7 TaxID=1974654 RepID=A0A2H0N224_9BACT|nr:MAG: NrdH-redoxin [Candidatus Magasanikbacteria bacterium CG11_big_fil_rev_8_21_14_0_20_43_7]
MKITIYSSPGFPACDELKQYLEDLELQFEEIDVSRDDLAWENMVHKSQQMSVPVIEIDDQIIIGFDRFRLDKLLEPNL